MTVPPWIESLKSAYEGILLLDEKSNITFCNQAAALMLDRSPHFIIGQPYPEFFITEPGVDPNSRQTLEYKAKANHLSKGPLPVHVRSLPLEPSSRLVFVRDLSDSEFSNKLIDLLAKVTEEIGSTLDIERTRQQVVQVPVPSLADWAALFSVNKEGIRYVQSFYSDNGHKNNRLVQYFTSKEAQFTENPEVGRAVLYGTPQFCSVFPEKDFKDMPLSQVLCLPLEVRHEVTGLLCLGLEYPKSFSKGDTAIAQEMTRRFASALENSQLHHSTVNMESQLIEAKRIAEEASQAKTKFLAAMSHEIRSPLSAILGFSELLLAEGSQSAEQLDWAERIRQNGAHLLRLIDEILNISKVESGKVVIEKQPISFSQLLTQLEMSEAPKAAKKNIAFEVKVTSPVPDQFISDPTRLNQILTNLIGNAIKFTSQGQVEVSLRYESQKDYLVIIISDTGPGLSAEQATKLFSPFTQADASHTRQFGGTGLGLAVSRQLARMLGGDVEILETELGKGTKFQLCLPIEIQPGTAFFSSLKEASSLLSRKATSHPVEKKLQNLKILVVDDSADNCMLASRFLKSSGAEVTMATSGRLGVQKALEENPSVVLMDVQMPDLDGRQATRELIQKGFRNPVIALTASVLQSEVNDCLEAGCAAQVAKPINRELLIKTISEVHEKFHASAETRKLLEPTAKIDMGG